jgi:hypothetical protein
VDAAAVAAVAARAIAGSLQQTLAMGRASQDAPPHRYFSPAGCAGMATK